MLTSFCRFDSQRFWGACSGLRSSRNHNIVTGIWLNVCWYIKSCISCRICQYLSCGVTWGRPLYLKQGGNRINASCFLMISGGTEVNWLALNIRRKFWTWSYRASSNGIKWRLRFTGFTTRKMSKHGVFSGPYFPVFSPNKRQYGPEKTLYLDTFYAVYV